MVWKTIYFVAYFNKMEKLQRVVTLYICISIHAYRPRGVSWTANTILRNILKCRQAVQLAASSPLPMWPWLMASPRLWQHSWHIFLITSFFDLRKKSYFCFSPAQLISSSVISRGTPPPAPQQCSAPLTTSGKIRYPLLFHLGAKPQAWLIIRMVPFYQVKYCSFQVKVNTERTRF